MYSKCTFKLSKGIIGPHKNCNIFILNQSFGIVDNLSDFISNIFSLCSLVWGCYQWYGNADRIFSINSLIYSLCIYREWFRYWMLPVLYKHITLYDDMVRWFNHHDSATIVLFQINHFGIWIVDLHFFKNSTFGNSPAIYGLIRITDSRNCSVAYLC